MSDRASGRPPPLDIPEFRAMTTTYERARRPAPPHVLTIADTLIRAEIASPADVVRLIERIDRTFPGLAFRDFASAVRAARFATIPAEGSA